MGRAATVTSLPVITPATQQALAGITRELQYEFLERDDEVTAVICALLARLNVLAFGEPGTGKTALLTAVTNRIMGANLGRWLMDRQMDKSEVLGLMDLHHYETTGEQKRVKRNTIFDADLLYFDEIDKCGPGVTTPLLTGINEHVADDGTEWVDLNVLTAMGSANEELEAGQEAFSDRFPVKLVFERLKQAENVLALLEAAVTPRQSAQPAMVDLAAVQQAVFTEVKAIVVPRTLLEAIAAVRAELAEHSIFPSDRKLQQCVRLVQAHAYLSGRETADEDDLTILRHALWDRQEEQQKVAEVVLSHTGPVTRTAITLMKAVMEMNAEIDKAAAVTPGDGESKTDVAGIGGRIMHQVGQVNEQIAKARAAAADAGRDTARLDEVAQQVTELQVRVFIECMGTPADAARKMVLSGV